MLAENEKILIASAVDGELSAKDEARLRLLLAESTGAMALYQAMLKDQSRVKALPRKSAPALLSQRVLAKVAPTVTPARKGRAEKGSWLPYAIVASLLISVTSVSYLYFVKANDQDVANKNLNLPKIGVLPENATNNLAVVDQKLEDKKVTVTETPKPEVTVNSTPKEMAPFPRKFEQSVFGAAVSDLPPLVNYDAKLPVLFTLNEINDSEIRAKVKAQLNQPPAIRVELFTKDPHRAADLTQTTLRANGINLSVDAMTAERIKAKLPLAWAVYSESLTAEEIVAFLMKLNDADTKTANAATMAHVHVSVVGMQDSKDIFNAFGIDGSTWKKAKPHTVNIANGTADKVTAAINKGVTGTAIMTTFLPNKLRVPVSQSREVKAFTERKAERKDNAVPLLIVLRPIG